MLRRVALILLSCLAALAVSCSRAKQSPEPAPATQAAPAATAPQQVEPDETAEPVAPDAVVGDAPAPLMEARPPVPSAQIGIHELRIVQGENGAPATEKYFEVARITAPSLCSDIDLNAAPILANAAHAVSSSQPHWKVDSYTASNGETCSAKGYTETPGPLPQGHALMGFDMEPERSPPSGSTNP